MVLHLQPRATALFTHEGGRELPVFKKMADITIAEEYLKYSEVVSQVGAYIRN